MSIAPGSGPVVEQDGPGHHFIGPDPRVPAPEDDDFSADSSACASPFHRWPRPPSRRETRSNGGDSRGSGGADESCDPRRERPGECREHRCVAWYFSRTGTIAPRFSPTKEHSVQCRMSGARRRQAEFRVWDNGQGMRHRIPSHPLLGGTGRQPVKRTTPSGSSAA